MKKTLILGASDNPRRYANLAAHRLVSHGHEIINVGIKHGVVAGAEIRPAGEIFRDVDTVTLYLGPQNQAEYYEYILETNPKRIIFNPGTENPVLEELAFQKGIETIEACTLVMLSTDQY